MTKNEKYKLYVRAIEAWVNSGDKDNSILRALTGLRADIYDDKNLYKKDVKALETKIEKCIEMLIYK